MKVLFVNVVNTKNHVHTRYYPLSFGYLKAYAEKQGCYFDCEYTEHLNRDVLDTVKPDVAALTCITEMYPKAKQYAQLIKKYRPHCKVMLGGVHISAVPNSLSRHIDIGVIGEGEQTFYELAQNGFCASPKICGLVYRDKDNVLKQTLPRQLIEPLDNIPHPDRSIFGPAKAPYLFTSRGCPYRCIFCSSSRFWQKVRLHSAKYVAEEIWQLYNSTIKHINIYDDTFLIDLGRVKTLKSLLPSDVTFTVAARANQLTVEACEVLKDLGVAQVGVGMESNSDAVLKILQKGNTSEDNQNAVDNLRKQGIRLSASFICNVPGETKLDLQETFRFIKRNKISYDLYRLMRFPNTPLYEGSTDWGKCKVRNVYTFKQHIGKIYHKIF